MRGLVRQFARFCAVGALGFVVDAGVLHLLLRHAGLDPFSGRLVSYLAAATATWALNRRFTFASADDKGGAVRAHRQWAEYLAVNAIGGGINYAVYAVLVLASEAFRSQPVLAVAAGSAVALAFNFLANRLVVFRAG